MGILVTDAEDTNLLANKFSLQEFGYTGEELTGKRVEVLIPSKAFKVNDEGEELTMGLYHRRFYWLYDAFGRKDLTGYRPDFRRMHPIADLQKDFHDLVHSHKTLAKNNNKKAELMCNWPIIHYENGWPTLCCC
ncbi:MAG TPA: hypothetical protein VFL76_08960 [Edaphocola sp.]|nr:hypothetical protein [Edaphocola sp.]